MLGVHLVAGLEEFGLLITVGDPVSPEPLGGRLRARAVSQLRTRASISCAVVDVTIHQVLLLPPGPLERRRRHIKE